MEHLEKGTVTMAMIARTVLRYNRDSRTMFVFFVLEGFRYILITNTKAKRLYISITNLIVCFLTARSKLFHLI